jgi:hypothetical protein
MTKREIVFSFNNSFFVFKIITFKRKSLQLKFSDQKLFHQQIFLSLFSLSNIPNCLKDQYFYNCSSLQSIKLPQNIEKISDSCFYECKNISYIFIQKSVASIYSSAFYGCKKLFENVQEKSFVIEEGSKFIFELIKEKCCEHSFREKEIIL